MTCTPKDTRRGYHHQHHHLGDTHGGCGRNGEEAWGGITDVHVPRGFGGGGHLVSRVHPG